MNTPADKPKIKSANQPGALLWLEWTTVFVAVPIVLRIWWQPRLVFALLLAATIWAAWRLARRTEFDRRLFWRGLDQRAEAQQLKRILLRFAICAALIAALVVVFYPQNLFGLLRRQPFLWAMIMIFYPILSVYPQELIYRAFFFERYRAMFPQPIRMIIVSGATFGFVHLIFQNPIAVLLTLVGGVFFAETYWRTKSLRLVWLEHSLYGCLIFTVGLGDFFYHGRVGQH